MDRVEGLEMLPYKPLTKEYWDDFVTLFGERGACGGCWCMNWRLMKADFEKGKGNGNKQLMKKLVASEIVPGIIGYERKQPIAWCSIAPRSHFPRMKKSRILSPVDNIPVWSVTCLFITKERQRTGLSSRLLLSAVDYAHRSGASTVEGYPFDPKQDNLPAPFVWTGLATAFFKAGFTEAARRSVTRPIMRINT